MDPDCPEFLALHIQEIQKAHAWALKSLCRVLLQVRQSHKEGNGVDKDVAALLHETIKSMKEAEADRDTILKAVDGSDKNIQRVSGRWWTPQAFADGLVSCFLDLPQRDMRTLTTSQVCHKFHAKFGIKPKDVADRFEGPRVMQFLAALPSLEHSKDKKTKDKYTRRLSEGVSALKYNGIYERPHIILGDEGVQRLQQANVLVVGCGGVGGWVAESIARAGVGAMTVIDFDTVDLTNKNRQLLALESTLGQNKAQAMANRIKDINPACVVTALEDMVTHENVVELLTAGNFTVVIDCIDTIAHKVALLTAAYYLCLPTFTSCGAAGKIDPMLLRVADILQTQGADVWSSFTRRLREELIARGVKEGGIRAVFSVEPSCAPLVPENVAGEKYRPRSTNGTISYIPPLFGFVLAGAVVNFLLAGGGFIFNRPQATPADIKSIEASWKERKRTAADARTASSDAHTDAGAPSGATEAQSGAVADSSTAHTAQSLQAAASPSATSTTGGVNPAVQDSGCSAKRFDTLRRLIGNTPLLRVNCRYNGHTFSVFCKLEAKQLTGSLKDRVALQILRDAYADGSVTEGTEIVEASSGCTGVALASVGAVLGHKVTIVIPDSVSRERMALLYAYGANIIPVPVEGSKSRLQSCLDFAKAYTSEAGGNRWQPRQFESVANVTAHQQSTGPEIVEALRRHGLEVTGFVAGVGTGGTVVGVGQCLKAEVGPNVAVHPLAIAECPMEGGYGRQRIQGLVEGFVPDILRKAMDESQGLLDPLLRVSDGDAILMAQKIARCLGLGVGMSSGANLIGAIQLWRRQHEASAASGTPSDTGPVIATIFCDCNKKYLTTDLIGKEIPQNDYLTPDVELLDFEVL